MSSNLQMGKQNVVSQAGEYHFNKKKIQQTQKS